MSNYPKRNIQIWLLEIRIVFTATTLIKSFSKIYWLKVVDVCQKTNSKLVQTLVILRRNTRGVFGQKWHRCFYHYFFNISQSQHRIVRVSRGSKKKSFALKLYQFCDLTTQQRFILQEEVNISKWELSSLVDSLRDFLETFDEPSECLQIPLPEPKIEIGSTKSKDNLFAHYYKDIIEHPNRLILLSFRFQYNNSCVSSI